MTQEWILKVLSEEKQSRKFSFIKISGSLTQGAGTAIYELEWAEFDKGLNFWSDAISNSTSNKLF